MVPGDGVNGPLYFFVFLNEPMTPSPGTISNIFPRATDPPACRRWGEAEEEKGPVDLFPAERTDEPLAARRP